jgi:hypothetical protein
MVPDKKPLIAIRPELGAKLDFLPHGELRCHRYVAVEERCGGLDDSDK